MKKTRNIIISLLIISMVFLNTGTYVFAAQSEYLSDDQISFEEYYSILKTEYAKYGIQYEILQRSDDVVFTKDLLKKQLKAVEQQGKVYLQQQKEEQKPNIKTIESSNIDLLDYSIIQPMLMYVIKNNVSDQVFRSPSGLGEANIRLVSSATADADTGRYLWINSYSNYQYGPYVNYKSWVITSESCYIGSIYGGNNTMTHYVSGLLTVEYTEVNTGLLVGYTSSHSVTNINFYR